MLVLADGQQQIELLLEQGVVVLQPESEERKRLDGRPTSDDHLRASAREQIEGGEVLKGAHRVLGAQHGDRAGQTNTLRPCRGGAEDDGRSRIQELATVVFTNAKRVQADRVGMFDLLDQLSQTIRWIQRATVLVERRRKTVNTHLHRCTSEKGPTIRT